MGQAAPVERAGPGWADRPWRLRDPEAVRR